MITRTLGAACVLYLTVVHPGHAESGIASVYAYGGSKTASGERANPRSMTAAHRTLPFGTIVRVTDLKSGRSVNVRINDRGPFRRDRIIDLSYEAARKLGFVARGTARVEITVVDREPRPSGS